MSYRKIAYFHSILASLIIAFLIWQTVAAKSNFNANSLIGLLADHGRCLPGNAVRTTECPKGIDTHNAAVSSNKSSQTTRLKNTSTLPFLSTAQLHAGASTTAPVSPTSGSTTPVHPWSHLMIALTIVVLMFRTQIMEWELLHMRRASDSP